MLMEKIKNNLKIKDDGNNKSKIENLVVFILILIITIIIINSIWNVDKKEKQEVINDPNKKLAGMEETKPNNNEDKLSTELEEILEKMKGVGRTKVLITYSQTSQTIPMYNEDTLNKETEEKDKGGGSRNITEKSMKRDVIYEEKNGTRIPITQSIVSPKIEGAIIIAEGADNVDTKANILQAVEAVTGIASHKIQVCQWERRKLKYLYAKIDTFDWIKTKNINNKKVCQLFNSKLAQKEEFLCL